MTDDFKWRHYEGEIILTSVRGYLRYCLSYRDMAKILSDRGLSVVHTTIFCWVNDILPLSTSPAGNTSSQPTIPGV